MAAGFGKVHVITGPGKGKTTAAFGMALRAAGHGLRVCIVQFLKTGMTTGEVVAVRRIREIQVHQFGTGRFVDPKNPSEEDRRLAGEALAFAKHQLEKRACDMLILDEVNTALSFGLIDKAMLEDLIASRGEGVELVLTGRNADDSVIALADYVSFVENRKHPFKEGLRARLGIEY